MDNGINIATPCARYQGDGQRCGACRWTRESHAAPPEAGALTLTRLLELVPFAARGLPIRLHTGWEGPQHIDARSARVVDDGDDRYVLICCERG